MGPLQFTITWYKNRHVGEQTAHWDLQNNILLFLRSQWAVCSPARRFLYHVIVNCKGPILFPNDTFFHVPLITSWSLVIVLWVRHAIFSNAWQAQTAEKKHRHFTIQTRFTDKFHSLSSIEVHSKLLSVHYEVGFSTSWHCQQTMKSVGIQCLLIIYQLWNQNSIHLLM